MWTPAVKALETHLFTFIRGPHLVDTGLAHPMNSSWILTFSQRGLFDPDAFRFPRARESFTVVILELYYVLRTRFSCFPFVQPGKGPARVKGVKSLTVLEEEEESFSTALGVK